MTKMGGACLVTGGAGFIGSALVRHLVQNTDWMVINVDNLTYAANLESLSEVEQSQSYRFEKTDIADESRLKAVFEKYKPKAVVHLAAESHVDRSIADAGIFIQTNILGTYNLLKLSREFEVERFLHVSTDEVYGDLEEFEAPFTERHPYAPSSPYSASKASSDHLVRAWHRTYGLPTLITNCSNNYGPWQFPEKLIPLVISNAVHGKPIPVYGTGNQVRDWLYVDDHARALALVLEQGVPGETYNVGSNNERKNLDVIRTLVEIMADFKIRKPEISFVADRPGHDKRYAIDASKIQTELGWVPQESFESGLLKTVSWYVNRFRT